MGRDGIGPEGVFQIAWIVICLVAIGVDWLVAGHVSKSFVVCVFSFYCSQILARFHNRLDTLRDDTNKIKEQNEDLQKQLKDLKKSLADVERQVRYVDIR